MTDASGVKLVISLAFRLGLFNINWLHVGERVCSLGKKDIETVSWKGITAKLKSIGE